MNNRVIIFNMLTGYTRSIIGAALSIFVVRWTLELLGCSDMGLYGVIGGVVFLFGFLTSVFQGVATRFFAFEIGKKGYTEAEGRKWFNTILSIVATVSISLLCVKYFVGLHALENWLEIPDGRMRAAVWAFRFLLASVFVSMNAVPYIAMLIANQAIALVSGVQLGQAILVFGVVFVLRFLKVNAALNTDAIDGLFLYSGVLSVISICGSLILVLFAKWRYAACLIDTSLWISKERISNSVSFMGWQLLGGIAWTIRGQFMTFFINRCFGTSFNASYTIASQVSNQASALAASFNDAISPVLTSEEGGGRREGVRRLARRGSFFAFLLVLFFAFPLVFIIEPVLEFWLKTPPPGCAELCIAMLLFVAIRQCAAGYGLAIVAHGRLGLWQICDACLMLFSIPAAIIFWSMGWGISSVGWALVISETGTSLNRYFFARWLLRKNDA